MKERARTIRWGGARQSPADLRSCTCPGSSFGNSILFSLMLILTLNLSFNLHWPWIFPHVLILLFSFENNFSEHHFKSTQIDFIFIILPGAVSFDRKIYVLRIYWDSWDGVFDFFFHLLLYVSSDSVWLLVLLYLYFLVGSNYIHTSLPNHISPLIWKLD